MSKPARGQPRVTGCKKPRTTEELREQAHKKFLHNLEVPVLHPQSFKPQDEHLDEARSFFDENGYILLDYMEQSQCDKAMQDLIRDVFMCQGHKAEYSVQVRAEDGHVLHPENDQDLEKLVRWFTKNGFSTSERKMLAKAAPRHASPLPAPCDRNNFHSNTQWALRTDKALQAFVGKLMNVPDDKGPMHADINRAWMRVPKEDRQHVIPGKRKGIDFVHIDQSPDHVFNGPFKERQKQSYGLSGKCHYTPGGMGVVPGSHKLEARQRFAESYRKHHGQPNSTKENMVFIKSEDPLDYFGQLRAIMAGPGQILFWHPDLVHAALGGSGIFSAGCYIGWDIRDDEHESEYLRRAGISEAEDRRNAFLHGSIPRLWPSLGSITPYPARYTNYPSLFCHHMQKIDQDDPWVRENMLFDASGNKNYHTIKKNGDKVQIVFEWGRRWSPKYKPLALTEAERASFFL